MYKYIIYTFLYAIIAFLLTIFYNFYNIIIEIYKLYWNFSFLLLFNLLKNLINKYSFFLSFFLTDYVSSLPRSFKKYDIFMRSRNMSNVWRSDVRMSNMSKSCRQTNFTLLNVKKKNCYLELKFFLRIIILLLRINNRNN